MKSINMKSLRVALLCLIFPLLANIAIAQRQMEKLNRGVVVVRQGIDTVYVGWRLFGTDVDDVSFNLYRKTGTANPVKLNASPITKSTNFLDIGAKADQPNSYFVKLVNKGYETETSEVFTLAANSPKQQYLNVPLRTPVGYTPNDCSVGDLDILHLQDLSRLPLNL